MPDYRLRAIADQLYREIRSRRLLDFPVSWSDEVVFPAYDGLSIRNIPHTIADQVGAPFEQSAPLDQRVWGDDRALYDVERVVLFLSDGLGYLYLQELMDEDPELADTILELTDGRGFVPITSIAPSTTAVALPTLWTGASPAAHGMLGTTMFLREFSTLANMLSYAPMGDPHSKIFAEKGKPLEDFVPVAGLAQHLAEYRVATHNLAYKPYINTGLSRILHRGVRYHYPHAGFSDFWVRVVDVLHETVGQRAYAHIYYHPVDALAHTYGAKNPYVHFEIKQQFQQLLSVLSTAAVQDGQTLFIMSADHGHADAPNLINLRDDPLTQPIRDAMRTGLTGDMRFAYLHLQNRKIQQVLDTVAQHYSHSLIAIESHKALEAGLLGTDGITDETLARIGDVILIPRKGYQVIDPAVGILDLVSWHAGLMQEEMLVPLIWKRI